MAEAKPGAGATPCKILSVTSDKVRPLVGERQVAVVMAVGRAESMEVGS
jgi:hypothetical protein